MPKYSELSQEEKERLIEEGRKRKEEKRRLAEQNAKEMMHQVHENVINRIWI
jgi:hypothetical protein